MAAGRIMSAAALVALAAVPATEGFGSAPLALKHPRCAPPAQARAGAGIGLRMALASTDPALAAARLAFVSAVKAAPKNGVGASEEQRRDIATKLEELVRRNPVKDPAKALLERPSAFWEGTPYALIYTNTTGASNGKIGPFVGDVWQSFLAVESEGGGKRGIFTNNLRLGPLAAELKAHCQVKSASKVDVIFDYTKFTLFGVQVSYKDFGAMDKPPKGSWDIKYMDEGLKVLYTNAGNVEILLREQE